MAGKGNPRTGGRAPGTPNKVTSEVREMALQALEQLGGVEYLVGLGRTDPAVFGGLLKKCIPQALEAKLDNASTLTVIDLSDVPKDIGPSVHAATLEADPVAALIEPKMPESLGRQELPADEPTYCRSKEDVAVDEGEAFERLPDDLKREIQWD